MSFHTLNFIARYEMKTLLRSWFFRIFAGLSILGLGIFNIAAMVDSSNAPWIFRAIPAAIPYANLIILNLGQAIVAVFLSTEFLKQDQKNDTIEVIYARNMSNSGYILGKTMGILLVFLVLNFIILGLGIGFSFLSNDSAFSPLSYLIYPLLISLPTLVFILGLSFLLMVLIKNQAITFIVLLGYIALTIFYLNEKLYHIFDYIAYQVPMMHSTLGGFGNLTETLIHRGIYFFLGVSFVFFTVLKLPRLPQKQNRKWIPFFSGVVAFGFALLGVLFYLHEKKASEILRKQMIEANNTCFSQPWITITNYQLNIEHRNKTLSIHALMHAKNKRSTSIDTLILQLNPSLEIQLLSVNEKPVEWNRHLQLIKIPLKNSIKPDDRCTIEISYQGTINENVAFLDRTDDDFSDNMGMQMYRVRKRYAYLTEDFVCLTRNVIWYPISGAGYNTIKPGMNLPDFSIYELSIKTKPGLTVITQGESISGQDSPTHRFHTRVPIPKISLLIGHYLKQSIAVDSINYSLYSWEKNNYFTAYFDSIQDTIPALIRDLRNEYESKINLTYPFKKLCLAEVPLHFSLDKHIFSQTSNAVQPQIIFYPEKGVVLESTDFKRRKKREERNLKRDNEEITAEELQIRMFKQVIRDNFITEPGKRYMYREFMNSSTLNLIPNYTSFVTQLHSEDWWVLNQALVTYLYNRNRSTGYTNPWSRDGLSLDEKINLELKEKSLEQLLHTGIRKEKERENSITINEVIEAKGMQLFRMLRARYGEVVFDNVMLNLMQQHQNESLPFDTLKHVLWQQFGEDITKDVSDWFLNNALPGYLIGEVVSEKIRVEEYTRYQVRFTITNPTRVDGQITASIALNAQNRRRDGGRFTGNIRADFSKEYFIPANSSRSVGMVFSNEPTQMAIYTNISENLPNYLVINLDGFDKLSSSRVFDTIREIPFIGIQAPENEYIVDNEDEGFWVEQTSEKGQLKAWVDKNRDPKYPYSRIRYWSPPREWQTVLKSEFFGKFVRSSVYTKAGSGERRVTWSYPLSDPGLYELFFYSGKVDMNRRGNRQRADYNFIIRHNEGEEKIKRSWEELEPGWNYLGVWYFSADTAQISLSNQSQGEIIFADAVKWVKQ